MSDVPACPELIVPAPVRLSIVVPGRFAVVPGWFMLLVLPGAVVVVPVAGAVGAPVVVDGDVLGVVGVLAPGCMVDPVVPGVRPVC